jgi:hypothetical protein
MSSIGANVRKKKAKLLRSVCKMSSPAVGVRVYLSKMALSIRYCNKNKYCVLFIFFICWSGIEERGMEVSKATSLFLLQSNRTSVFSRNLSFAIIKFVK